MHHSVHTNAMISTHREHAGTQAAYLEVSASVRVYLSIGTESRARHLGHVIADVFVELVVELERVACMWHPTYDLGVGTHLAVCRSAC